jgi:magnesium-transporting ATPase (P-type)
MELSKNQKLLLGILHFLPIVGIIAYFIYFFSFFINNVGSLQNQPKDVFPVEFFKGFFIAFVIIIITVILSIGIKIFDIIHLVRNNKNDTGNKVLLWVLLFIFTGSIAEIVYFFLEILPEKKQEIKES